MGVKTLYGYFYKLAYGDKGADKATLVNDCLDVADAEIKANKDAKHTQGTDQGLDTGGENAVVVADVKDAVTKKHAANTDTDLDATFEATFAKKADKLSVFALTTSAELAEVISDKTGTGKAVFNTSPVLKGINLNPRISQGLVTFIFDDTYATNYTVMKPVFDNQGEVACSAIWTDQIGESGRLTPAQLLELQSADWETLSHSQSHVDLTTLNEAQITDEVAGSKQILTDYGLVVKNFAYPYGTSNETVRRIVREYYRSARGTEAVLNSYILNTFCLSAVIADNPANLAAYKVYVDNATSEKKWLIFFMHETDAADAAAIDELIDYIQAKGISIVTVDQALDLVGNVIDIGDSLAIGKTGIKANLFGTQFAATGSGGLVFSNSPVFSGHVGKSRQISVTAHAGGGQANAVQITADIVEISVCASAGDSVRLPKIGTGGGQTTATIIIITNHGAQSANVYTVHDDSFINSLALNAPKALAVNATMLCIAWTTNHWECLTLAR